MRRSMGNDKGREVRLSALAQSVRRTISGYVFRPIKVQALGQVEQVPVHLLGNVLAYKKAPSLLRFRWSFAAPLHVVLLSCAAIVSGCATGPTATIPVPVSCLKSEPPAMPQTATEAEILAMNEYAATLTIFTERLELKAFAAKADAIIQACR
jgi:hypothetical protein